MAHQGDDISIANITVVGPDDHPSSIPMSIPVGSMFKSDASPDAFFSHSPEPDLIHFGAYSHDGDSSGGNVAVQPLSPTQPQRDDHSGYSTPLTPYSIPQYSDLHPLDTQGLGVSQEHAFEQALGGSPLNGSFSPSTLSPSFGGLSLADPAGDGQIFNSKEMSPFFSPSLEIQEPEYNDSRGSLSLMIPSPSNDNTAFTKDIFPFDEAFETTPSQPFDSNSLGGFIPNDSLNVPGPTMQRPVRHMHGRGLSVAGTSWTPAASPSPSLSFTPSEYTSSASLSSGSGGLFPPTPYHTDDYSILSEHATVQRRHTSAASHSRSPSRGRPTDTRLGGGSASSSRRSSPYPSSRPSGSPSDTLSPNQVWQQNDHLAVPVTSPTNGLGMDIGGASISRRHSFNGSPYSRGGSMGHDMHLHAQPRHIPVVASFDDSHHSASSSTSSLNTPQRKVASNAGIKASEARRTKEARFKCEMCSQTFTTNHNLKNHVNVHYGVKEHSCASCKRDFTTQSVLARHMKTCKMANVAS